MKGKNFLAGICMVLILAALAPPVIGESKNESHSVEKSSKTPSPPSFSSSMLLQLDIITDAVKTAFQMLTGKEKPAPVKVPIVGSNCTKDGDCKSIPRGYCKNNKCERGPVEHKVGSYCSTSSQCRSITSTFGLRGYCIRNKCAIRPVKLEETKCRHDNQCQSVPKTESKCLKGCTAHCIRGLCTLRPIHETKCEHVNQCQSIPKNGILCKNGCVARCIRGSCAFRRIRVGSSCTKDGDCKPIKGYCDYRRCRKWPATPKIGMRCYRNSHCQSIPKGFCNSTTRKCARRVERKQG